MAGWQMNWAENWGDKWWYMISDWKPQNIDITAPEHHLCPKNLLNHLFMLLMVIQAAEADKTTAETWDSRKQETNWGLP